MHKPYISVIIPLYNKEPIIERTVKSVLSQSFTNFEVVIVNDGSTDGSMDIVRSISDPRIVIIEQENGGPSKARNTGVRASKGDWIVFLDADDEFLDGAFSIFFDAIKANDDCNLIAFPYYNKNKEKMTLMDYTNNQRIKNPFKCFFYGEIAPRMGSFICAQELALLCPFNERIRRYEDDEMLLRMYSHATMSYISKPVMIANQAFSAASHAREDISEDFLGHLQFKGKTFWEKMCLYKMFIGERPHYQEQCKKLYPSLYYRYDLLFLYKAIKKWC